MCIYCVLLCVYMGAGLPLLLSILVVETLRLALTDFTSLARQQAQGPLPPPSQQWDDRHIPPPCLAFCVSDWVLNS